MNDPDAKPYVAPRKFLVQLDEVGRRPTFAYMTVNGWRLTGMPSKAAHFDTKAEAEDAARKVTLARPPQIFFAAEYIVTATGSMDP